MISELEQIDVNLTKTIMRLFEEEFTIPFLCRYRNDLIKNLPPEKLLDIKNTIDHVKLIEAKSLNILKALEKEKILTDEIYRNVKSAKSLAELEHISSLHRKESKGSLYERAKKIGLEPAAENILYGTKNVNLSLLVNLNIAGLNTPREIEVGVKNIISHLISKNEFIMNEVRELRNKYGVTILSSQVKKKKTDSGKEKDNIKQNRDLHKFENYFNFSCPADRIKPHQILALNRGESLKVTKIKL